jgi:hypothetical protein
MVDQQRVLRVYPGPRLYARGWFGAGRLLPGRPKVGGLTPLLTAV